MLAGFVFAAEKMVLDVVTKATIITEMLPKANVIRPTLM